LTSVTSDQFCSAANPNIKFNHGTTTLGFLFKAGVLLGT
jgi:hypothetical protein